MRVAASLSEVGKDGNKRTPEVKVCVHIYQKRKTNTCKLESHFYPTTARDFIPRAWWHYIASPRTTTQHRYWRRDQHRNTTQIIGNPCAHARERSFVQGYLPLYNPNLFEIWQRQHIVTQVISKSLFLLKLRSSALENAAQGRPAAPATTRGDPKKDVLTAVLKFVMMPGSVDDIRQLLLTKRSRFAWFYLLSHILP